MSYRHLSVVIEAAKKFEDHFSNSKQGFSSNDVMQVEGSPVKPMSSFEEKLWHLHQYDQYFCRKAAQSRTLRWNGRDMVTKALSCTGIRLRGVT